MYNKRGYWLAYEPHKKDKSIDDSSWVVYDSDTITDTTIYDYGLSLDVNTDRPRRCDCSSCGKEVEFGAFAFGKTIFCDACVDKIGRKMKDMISDEDQDNMDNEDNTAFWEARQPHLYTYGFTGTTTATAVDHGKEACDECDKAREEAFEEWIKADGEYKKACVKKYRAYIKYEEACVAARSATKKAGRESK